MREDYGSNFPEDAAAYEWARGDHGYREADDRPTRAEVDAEEADQ